MHVSRIITSVWKAGSMLGVLNPVTCLHYSVHAHQSTLHEGFIHCHLAPWRRSPEVRIE